jgi:hypothetical protein
MINFECDPLPGPNRRPYSTETGAGHTLLRVFKRGQHNADPFALEKERGPVLEQRP